VAAKVHPSDSLHAVNPADELATRQPELEVVVVSPARPIYEGRARWVTVRLPDGQLGVWPRHTDLVAALGVGLMRLGHTKTGKEDQVAVWGGFLKVTGGHRVTILVDRAVNAEEARANEPRIREELAQVLEALRHPATNEEFNHLLDRRRWLECQVRLCRP